MAGELPRMLTANRLGDGAVVYLAEGGRWVEEFVGGAILRDDASTKDAVDSGDAAVADRLVIGPYLIEVQVSTSGPAPISVRERIRADRGPTFAVDAGSWTGRIKD
jgi:hypothetical protein